MNVGLRRYTTHIQTGSSHVVTFEDCDLQAVLGGIFSGAVTSRPRANDNYVCANHFSFVI